MDAIPINQLAFEFEEFAREHARLLPQYPEPSRRGRNLRAVLVKRYRRELAAEWKRWEAEYA